MYDIIIIGGGPGGYVAGSYAAQYGKKVAIIEKKTIGGCCLNEGCIPAKTLLETAMRYEHAIGSDDYGIKAKVSFNWKQFKEHMEKVRGDLKNGVNHLLKSRKCDIIVGEAKLVDNHTVKVGKKVFTAESIIIATGSKPTIPEKFSALKNVFTSDSFWNLEDQPKSIVIVGGGVIGCEIASALSRLGSSVTIIEQMPEILPMFDTEAVKLLREELVSSEVDILLGNTVEDIKETTNGLEVIVTGKTICCEYLLWTTGRRATVPNYSEMDLDLDESGFIKVDSDYKTNIRDIYCIGDANGKGMLAHVAISQAMLVVKHICTGEAVSVNPCIPQTVFTYPAIACVGQLECEGAAVGKVSYTAVGYSYVVESKNGFFKVIRDITTDTLIGAEIVGYNACELIHILVPLINKKIEVGMLMDTIFAHPTLSEGIKLAIENSYIRSPQV